MSIALVISSLSFKLLIWIWVARGAAAFLVATFWKYRLQWTGRNFLRWILTPIIYVTALLFIDSGIPRQTRWNMCQPALARYAQRLMDGETKEKPRGTRVATVKILDVQLVDGGVVLVLDSGFLFTGYGIVYYPSEPPEGEKIGTPFMNSDVWYEWSGEY